MAKKRVRDREQKINKILWASYQLINRKGYANVSTNLIAEKASVAIGTLYKYFPEGKPDILRAIYQKGSEHAIQQFIPEKLDILSIEDIRQSEFYKKSLLKNIISHREGISFVKAYESEILVNDKFYFDTKETYYDSEIFEIAVKKVLKQDKEFINKLREKFIRISLIKEFLLHRHVLFPDVFESDEEFADIILEIFIALTNYYLKKGDSL